MAPVLVGTDCWNSSFPIDDTYTPLSAMSQIDDILSEEQGDVREFVKIMTDPTNQVNKEKNFEARLAEAIKQSGVAEDVMTRAEVKDLLHYRLSYVLYNNKYQRLLTKQVQLWNLCRLTLNDFGNEDMVKDVGLHDKINELIDRLSGQVESLYSEIYGAPEIQDIAKEQVKRTMSPEQRLKKNKKG